MPSTLFNYREKQKESHQIQCKGERDNACKLIKMAQIFKKFGKINQYDGLDSVRASCMEKKIMLLKHRWRRKRKKHAKSASASTQIFLQIYDQFDSHLMMKVQISFNLCKVNNDKYAKLHENFVTDFSTMHEIPKSIIKTTFFCFFQDIYYPSLFLKLQSTPLQCTYRGGENKPCLSLIDFYTILIKTCIIKNVMGFKTQIR